MGIDISALLCCCVRYSPNVRLLETGDVEKWDVTATSYAIQGCEHCLVPEPKAEVVKGNILYFDKLEEFAAKGQLTVAELVPAVRILKNNNTSHAFSTDMARQKFDEVAIPHVPLFSVESACQE